MISQAANGYAKAAPGSIVTLTPYVEADFWTNVLIQTATATGNNVSWINLMLYMGVYNTDPGDWPGDLAPWLSAVTAPGTNISTAQAPAFVPTGCFANGTNGSGPGGAFTYTDLSAAVANIYAQYPTMGGAFIWSFGQTGNDTAAWASAIAPSQSVKSGAAKRIKR